MGKEPSRLNSRAIYLEQSANKLKERKGLPLTDDHIREKARAFCATSASPESHSTLTASWIEKFKLKNNLMGARSRKGSLIPEDDEEEASAEMSLSHTPNGTSPISPHDAGSPTELHSAQSHESLQDEKHQPNYFDHTDRSGPFHSQSHNSLHSAFTDTAPSSFSPTPLSPTTSPFFTPDSGTAPSPFVPQPKRQILPASTASGPNSHRPRSQTFPLLDQYMTGMPMTIDESTPKYITSSNLDSPMEEPPDPMMTLNSTVHGMQGDMSSQNLPIHGPHPGHVQQTISPTETMGPPPLPASAMMREPRHRSITPATSNSPLQAATSPEDARKALEVVLGYFEQQPNGFLDLQESMMIGRLMEKLKLQAHRSSH